MDIIVYKIYFCNKITYYIRTRAAMWGFTVYVQFIYSILCTVHLQYIMYSSFTVYVHVQYMYSSFTVYHMCRIVQYSTV